MICLPVLKTSPPKLYVHLRIVKALVMSQLSSKAVQM